MTWQDLVLATCSLCFTVAIVPAIRSPQKPPLATSAMNAGVLAIFSGTLATLSLWYSAVTALTTCIAWAILAVQVGLRRES